MFFPDPCPGGVVRQRDGGKEKLINQTSAGKGMSGSARPERGSSRRRKSVEGLLKGCDSQAVMPPSQPPRSWLLVQGKEHKFLWKLSFKHFFKNPISPRFSASLPTCYSSFLNITIPDWDCQALSCGEAPRLWSRCTSHMPPGCRCFQDPPKAPPLCQKISEHLVSVHVVF